MSLANVMTPLVTAYVLIVVGLLLGAAELVLFANGVLAAIGLVGVVVGVVMVLGESPLLGIFTLLGMFVVIPFLSRALFRLWAMSPIGRRLLLQPPAEQVTIADTPQAHTLETLRGRIGRTTSMLRPAGMVDFDGRRVDAVSEGTLIEAGQWVRCVSVQAGIVVVRPTEGPVAAGNLEDMKL